LKYSIINCRFSGSLLGNRRCYVNNFGPHSLAGRPDVGFQEWSSCDHP